MEKFVELGTERISLSEIRSYNIHNDKLCIETDYEYLTYKKEDIENFDLVIKYLDDNLDINNSKTNVSKLETIESKTSLDITWDDILKGNIFNTDETSLIPITVITYINTSDTEIDKLNVLNNILKLMKENIKEFNPRSSLSKFRKLIDFDNDGFIKGFTINNDFWAIQYGLTNGFNYLMIEVIKQLYSVIKCKNLINVIPEFSWDVEQKINHKLQLDDVEISLIIDLISGKLFSKLHLSEVEQLDFNLESKEIINTYFDLKDIYMKAFLRDITNNIIEERNPYMKFSALRILFCFNINRECGIDQSIG
jgi:hypothetical protein